MRGTAYRRGPRNLEDVPAKLVFEDGTEMPVLVDLRENLTYAGDRAYRGYPDVTATGRGSADQFERLWDAAVAEWQGQA